MVHRHNPHLLWYNYLYADSVDYLPVAVMSVNSIPTIISVDDGLLRISLGCSGPALSFILYTDRLNAITPTTWLNNTYHTYKSVAICT